MLKKVTRREAQKALIAGNPVYLLPNRMQVDSPWAHPFRVKTPMSEEKFNRLIMKYEHACCTVDTGTGSFCYIDLITKRKEYANAKHICIRPLRKSRETDMV